MWIAVFVGQQAGVLRGVVGSLRLYRLSCRDREHWAAVRSRLDSAKSLVEVATEGTKL